MTRTRTPTEVIASRLRNTRRAFGWTQEDVAQRCREAGLEWDRNVVANVETNRRAGLTLDEVLMLALVLSVPPLLLFVPLGSLDSVSLGGGRIAHPDQLRKWFEGSSPSPFAESSGQQIDVEAWSRSLDVLQLHHRLDDALAQVKKATEARNRAAFVGAPAQVQHTRQRLAVKIAAFANELAEMSTRGYHPPPVPKWLIDEMKEMGINIAEGVRIDE